MMQREEWSFMDLVSMASFLLSIANLEQNLDQNQLQGSLNRVMADVHSHLQEQDEKLDQILSLLTRGGY